MRRARVVSGTVVAALTMLTLVGGCASGPTSTQGTGPVASAPGSASGSEGPAPQAATPTEVNPPGDIPDNQAFVAWSPADNSLTVEVPEGWARTTAAGVTVFTDKLNSVAITESADPNRPTVASVARDLTTVKAASTGWQDGTVTAVTRPAGAVIRTTYRADAPADPVTGKVRNDDVERYVFHRGSTTAVLTLSGPHGADNVDPWRIVTDSFAWTL